jgi:gas vesicle protein
MELGLGTVVKYGIAVGAGVGLCHLASKAKQEVRKGELVDEAKRLEQDILLVKDATYSSTSELSDRERGAALDHLNSVHMRVKQFQDRNKPSPEKVAEKLTKGIDTASEKSIGVFTKAWRWAFGGPKEEKEEIKTIEAVEIKTPVEPATT